MPPSATKNISLSYILIAALLAVVTTAAPAVGSNSFGWKDYIELSLNRTRTLYKVSSQPEVFNNYDETDALHAAREGSTLLLEGGIWGLFDGNEVWAVASEAYSEEITRMLLASNKKRDHPWSWMQPGSTCQRGGACENGQHQECHPFNCRVCIDGAGGIGWCTGNRRQG